ncbi:glycosyltransferase [Aquimarina sp. 2201CG14-23]|uniref:glycosyltransferase n=1 Tax=Aquimarina mycalae TaxID=3040073 RepID=UPI002477EDED|nr:glycosyltransferase [Aquimarina sp. 2201CG14-23]MDH7446571.1 glycosyltransferase [Aquimarina sp. 2201CG14-23]
MTILHVITGLSGGGAEHMVLELASQSNNTADKTVVVSVSERKQILHKFEEKGIECHFLNITSIKSLFLGLKYLKQIHKTHKDTVFHCHMFHGFAIGFLYKLFFRNVPIVFTLHTNSVKQLYRKLFFWTTKIFRKKDIIFSNNSRKWYLKNSTVIPNGVDLDKFKRNTKLLKEDTNKPFVFLFLGRLTEPKNPLFLVDLIQRLKAQNYVDFIINVVGDGGLRENLETAIEQNGVTANIKLFGFQKNVSGFLKEANCLIIPSLWEGMPVSIIEAGASKLPVVSTPVGSIPDFLNNDNAYVSELDNFHTAMISVLKDYKLALQKGENLFELVKSKYDIKKIYKLHIDLYQSTLK